MSVCAVRSVEIALPEMDAAREFYEERWGLEIVERDGPAVYFRGTGLEHHILVLRPGPEPALARLNFAAPDRAAVDRLFARLEGTAGCIVSSPRNVDEPGGGYGFSVRDPEGRIVSVAADVDTHAHRGTRANVPVKISHVVMHSVDADAASRYYSDHFGFRVRDRTKAMDFLGCNPDHHSLAFVRGGPAPLVHHIAFELTDIDAVMRGAGRLKRSRIPLEWGVGRHGPGNNVFAYFYDPAGFVVEYTTEMQQVDDTTYRVGTPQDWDRPTNSDQWGVAGPPSERFLAHSPPRA